MDNNRLEGAAKELGGKVQGALGDAFGSEKDSVEGRRRQAEGAAQNILGQGKDAVREATHDAQKYATDLYENAGAYAEEGTRAVRRTIHEHPLSSLLAAGAIGFVLGLLARDRD